MPKYRVRAPFRHEGVDLGVGVTVELSRRIAREFPHLVDEVDGAGRVLITGPPAWRQALEGVRDHEKASILAEQRVGLVTNVETAATLADEAATDAKQAAANHLTAQAALKDLDAAIAALTPAPAAGKEK